MSTLDERAIDAALSGHWSDAVDLNKQIIASNTSNIDAMNRLAYAHAKCGNYKEACDTYQKVLKLDSYNPLATKNLAKFKQYHNTPKPNHTHTQHTVILPGLFLSDVGKTKTVNLINLASQQILQDIAVGIEVYALPKRFELHIRNNANQYLGTLPDDVGHPLLKLFKTTDSPGCRFFVKDVANNRVTIFIKY